ncbi:MAG: amino acid permease [Bacteroidia bacterium]|nr:amino acid permease [Bacteroidia bacterium]
MRIGNLFQKKSISMILHDSSDLAVHGSGMRRTLGVVDLTALGVAAIVGAGIFSTIGNAAATGGPAVSLLFVFTAIACGLSAMCYAEFASAIPISGSAYTYAYASFGELVAWIIGWDLIMEYAIGNIAVAISWSGYFTGLLSGFGLHIYSFLTTDYLTALRGYHEALVMIQNGVSISSLSPALNEAYQAWTTAPQIFNFRLIADIPAFMIVVLITWICYIGIRESKRANNMMVLLKVGVLILVIAAGAFYVDPANWSPFAPNGLPGVLKGISGVFFAYIGFDAISTTAEECKNPKKDLPRSMFYALLITTVLYVLVSLVLTGMVPYDQLGVADPLAFVFAKLHLAKLSGIIAISAVIAMASVLLVFQLGQPRIWMSMSRDGLLPPIFAKLHPKYRTPGFSTIVTGFLVALPALFMNLTEVTDLTSIGTLFAFILVSGGILIINPKGSRAGKDRGFVVPYFNSRYFIPPTVLVVGFLLTYTQTGVPGLKNIFLNYSIHSIPYILFWLTTVIVTIMAVVKSWSYIPVIGLLTNFYLMSELGITNWTRFGVWLVIGLLLYFSYGIFHSKLNESKEVVV